MGTNPDYAQIGSKIRARRLRLGMTMEELAEGSGRHPTYIGQIERGSKKATLETLGSLVQVLGMEMRDLFNPISAAGKAPVARRIGVLLNGHDPVEREFLFATLRGLARGLKRLRD